MKKRIIFLFIFFATLLIWMVVVRQPKTTIKPIVPPSAAIQPTPNPSSIQSAILQLPVSRSTELVRLNSIDEDTWNQLMQMRRMSLDENQPIKFYARVIDQNQQPVEGATLQISVSRVDEKMFETTNFFHMKMGSEIVDVPINILSDVNGWLLITNITGATVRVKELNKEGYSWTMPQIGSFLYKANGKHRVSYDDMEDAFDPNKGFIFHMQKISETNSVK